MHIICVVVTKVTHILIQLQPLDMAFIKQKATLQIRNVDESLDVNRTRKKVIKHSVLLPNSIRCLILGPSNSGKTNVIISLLEDSNGLRFENVYIYSNSLYQPKYVYLKELLTSIKGIGLYTYSSNDDVIPLEKVKSNSIFVFDDVICEKQNNIRNYFCMGRHKGVDCFYLCQSYAHIPKHLIRDNANLLVLFKQDETNLKHIFNDYGLSCDMAFNKFKAMCNRCWSENYGFVVIDIERTPNNGKYRLQFDKFISIDEFQ